MTTPAPLSREEKRVKIAEACGWLHVQYSVLLAEKLHSNPPIFWVGISPLVQTLEHGKNEKMDCNYWPIPDYFSDLNAMNEAEKVLTDEQFELYAFWLAHLTPLGKQICASAAQRAEAFGKTLGLW